MSYPDYNNHGRSSRSIPPGVDTNQAHHYEQQNALPARDHGQLEGHWEGAPQPVEGVADRGIPQDPRFNSPHHGVAGYHPLMPGDPEAAAAPYAFRNIGFAQGIPPQGQDDAPENRGYGFLDYAPQYVAPGPAQAAFHPPFVHRPPTPEQLREDNLRRLISRFLYHPDSRVNMVWMEPGAAGRFEIVIVLEASDVL